MYWTLPSLTWTELALRESRALSDAWNSHSDHDDIADSRCGTIHSRSLRWFSIPAPKSPASSIHSMVQFESYIKRFCDQLHHAHSDFIHSTSRIFHRSSNIPRVLAVFDEVRFVLLSHHAHFFLHIHYTQLQQRARNRIFRMRTRDIQEIQIKSEERSRRMRRFRAFFAQRGRQKLRFDVENRGKNVVKHVHTSIGWCVDHFHDGIDANSDPLRARHLCVGSDQQIQKDRSNLRAIGAIPFGELVEQQCDERRMHGENIRRWVALKQNGENRKRATRCAGIGHRGLQAGLDHGDIHAFLRSTEHFRNVLRFAWWNSPTIPHKRDSLFELYCPNGEESNSKSIEWEAQGSSFCA